MSVPNAPCLKFEGRFSLDYLLASLHMRKVACLLLGFRKVANVVDPHVPRSCSDYNTANAVHRLQFNDRGQEYLPVAS